MHRCFWITLTASLINLTSFAQDSKPIESPTVLSRIAFGSCGSQERPQPAWLAIEAADPQLMIMLGDNIYGDTKDMSVMQSKYDKLAAMPGFDRLRKQIPFLATWDDHDFGVNDGGLEYPMKDQSQQLFLDFFGVPKDSLRRTRKGVYHSEVYGPVGKRVQIIMLDTRYFRSPLKEKPTRARNEGPYMPNTEAGATILGEDQWRWLADQLAVPAELRIIGSSIQLVPEDHGWEKWMNIPEERKRLFDLINTAKAEGVMVISGDRHLAELSVMDAGVGYPIFDLTSSGLNMASKFYRPLEVNTHRISTLNWGDNFGFIKIDWEKPDPEISLQIRYATGDVFLDQKVNMSVLKRKEARATR